MPNLDGDAELGLRWCVVVAAVRVAPPVCPLCTCAWAWILGPLAGAVLLITAPFLVVCLGRRVTGVPSPHWCCCVLTICPHHSDRHNTHRLTRVSSNPLLPLYNSTCPTYNSTCPN